MLAGSFLKSPGLSCCKSTVTSRFPAPAPPLLGAARRRPPLPRVPLQPASSEMRRFVHRRLTGQPYTVTFDNSQFEQLRMMVKKTGVPIPHHLIVKAPTLATSPRQRTP